MNIEQRITRILGILLAASLCVTPEMMHAAQQNTQAAAPIAAQSQTNSQGSNQAPQGQPNNESQQQTKPQGSGTTIDPSQAPLQPVTTYPEAPTPQQDQQPNGAQPVQGAQPQPSEQDQSKQQPKKPVEPAGAATAEKVPTTGGAASRPAGVAIAPAKQHQTRSLLIRIGAIAAAGVAAGTVYGLSRSTHSTPGLAAATRK